MTLLAVAVRELVEKAKRSLPSSRNVLEDGDCDFAVSRAYYAIFYAEKAALLARGVSRAKHSGVIAAFGEVERWLTQASEFVAAVADLLRREGSDV